MMTHCPEDEVFSIILCVLDFSFGAASSVTPSGELSLTTSFNVEENKAVEAVVAGIAVLYDEPMENATLPSWLRDRAVVSNTDESFMVLDHTKSNECSV